MELLRRTVIDQRYLQKRGAGDLIGHSDGFLGHRMRRSHGHRHGMEPMGVGVDSVFDLPVHA